MTSQDFIALNFENPTSFIARSYEQGSAFTWGREFAVNAIQAHAETVIFDVDWQTVKDHDIYRRVIVDDGDGMSPEQMAHHLTYLGNSSGDVFDTSGNYGLGARISSLGFNAHGVVYISKDSNGNISLVWNVINPASGEFGTRTFDGQTVVSLNSLKEFSPVFGSAPAVDWVARAKTFFAFKKTGTVIFFLGNTGVEDTIFGDPNRSEESKITGLHEYLSSRFYSFGSSAVKVQTRRLVGAVLGTDKKNWPKNSKGNSLLTVKPLSERLDELIAQAGGTRTKLVYKRSAKNNPLAVQIEEVLLAGDMPKGQIGGHLTKLPAIGLLVENHGVTEVYDSSFGDRRGMESLGAPAKLAPFVPRSRLRKRTAILMRPLPGQGQSIFPDGTSRSGVTFRNIGGKNIPMPYEQWAALYSQSPSQQMKDAIEADYASSDPVVSNEKVAEQVKNNIGTFLTKMSEAYKLREGVGSDLLKVTGKAVPTPPDSGEPTGEGSGKAKKPALPPVSGETKPGGGTSASRKTKGRVGVISAIFDEELDGPAATLDLNKSLITLNRFHPVVRFHYEYAEEQYAEKYGKTRLSKAQKRLHKLIEEQLSLSMSESATMFVGFAFSSESTEDSYQKVSEDALVPLLLGFPSTWRQIQPRRIASL